MDADSSRRDSFSKVPNRSLAAKTRFYGYNWKHFTFGSSSPLPYIATVVFPLFRVSYLSQHISELIRSCFDVEAYVVFEYKLGKS
jgi:hypothetical protein